VDRLPLELKSEDSSVFATNRPLIRDPNDVLIQVMASSVNPLDIMMAKGYGHQLLHTMSLANDCGSEKVTHDRFPLVLGRDFSGVIIRTGSRVSKYKVGDKVWGAVGPHRQGSHANILVASQNEISLKPKNLEDVEAASLPYVGLTSWSALCTFGGLNESNSYGKRVLVLGGSGGIGTFAIQLLKAWGSHVTATCSPDAMSWLQETTRVDDCVDYHTNELTSLSNSFDIVFDASTGHGQGIDPVVIQCLKKWKNSRYVTVTTPLIQNLDKQGMALGLLKSALEAGADTVRGIQEGTSIRWAYYCPNPVALEAIARMVEQNKIKPVIQNVFSFDKIPEAYKKANEGHARGKIVVKL
jgi:NADPH:quinone reductase-like Zn-dependent oxidoreductase